ASLLLLTDGVSTNQPAARKGEEVGESNCTKLERRGRKLHACVCMYRLICIIHLLVK
uniref:Uncharacterized protein n=1 Tax=Oryza brachyantha TaxID=4533 RepID=J3L1D3_ORYBR